MKSALLETAYDLTGSVDMNAVFTTARAHGATALAYYGAINCGVDASSEVMRDAFSRVCRELLVAERQTADVASLTKKLAEIGVDFMPLKGVHLKKLYPKSEMRRMSDADILVKIDQYDCIRPLMLSLGYTEGVESDHEYNWQKGSTHIELHKYLIPSYNKDYFAYFGDGWRLAKRLDDSEFEYGMNAEDEMIYLFTHFAKHYRDSGIGVRHMTDLWVFRSANPNLDEGYIKAELKKLQLVDFYANIIRTIAVWFEGAEGDEVTDFITEAVFASGEFGHKATGVISSALKEKKTGKNANDIVRQKVLHSLFLPYKHMCVEYPVLKKAPALLPIMWCVRIVSRVLTKNKVKSYVEGELNISDEKIDAYQQTLNFVGLDFNFPEE